MRDMLFPWKGWWLGWWSKAGRRSSGGFPRDMGFGCSDGWFLRGPSKFCPEFASSYEGWRKGMEIHAFVVWNSVNDVKFAIRNGLDNMYAKCGSIDNASPIFKLILFTWNTMIYGFNQNGCLKEALTNFLDEINWISTFKLYINKHVKFAVSLSFICVGSQILDRFMRLCSLLGRKCG